MFDQLTQVVQGDPPCLNDVRFSVEFIDFVNTWSVLIATAFNMSVESAVYSHFLVVSEALVGEILCYACSHSVLMDI